LRTTAELRDRIAMRDSVRVSRGHHETALEDHQSVLRARLVERKARTTWVLPISHYRLTAGFGDYGLWSQAHTGQDFAAPIGTPVRSAGAGTIIFAGYDGAYGYKIVVEHPDGLVTWYAHLSSFVRTTGPVRAGELIGRVGSTGNVTGPHLHFEVRPHDGAAVDPLPWLAAHHIKY
nr:M23 family metallopeptidase [Propionibacteriales bacterium]